jgi:hypothetical protein
LAQFIGTGPGCFAGLQVRSFLDLLSTFFLRFMMLKSHSPDKRCPQGCLRGQHEAYQAMNKFRLAEGS